MGPRKCGLILQVALQYRGHLTQKIALWTKSRGLIIKGGLKIQGCKIEGLLYYCYLPVQTDKMRIRHSQPVEVTSDQRHLQRINVLNWGPKEGNQ